MSTTAGREEGLRGQLATYLAEKVLPNNYRGVITVWACQSARPLGEIPDVKAQLEKAVRPTKKR